MSYKINSGDGVIGVSNTRVWVDNKNTEDVFTSLVIILIMNLLL